MRRLNNRYVTRHLLMFADTGEEQAGGGESETPTPTDNDGDTSDEQGAGSKAAVLADLQRERDRRRAAETRLKELEDAKLTDTERRERDLQDALKRADDATLELARVKAAVNAGLPVEMAGRLQGADADALAADAEALKELIGTAKPEAPVRRDYGPDPSQGKGRPLRDGGSVSAGRDLYAEMHQKTTN